MPNASTRQVQRMNDEEKRSTIERYNSRLDQYGHDARTLGWTKRQHLLRYEILLSYWDFSLADSELLDFGYGFGDMYDHCRRSGRTGVRYHGVDLNARLIEAGRARYPEVDLRALDIAVDGLPQSYDVIVASGVYNFRMADNWGFVRETFDIFRTKARRGFAANFITDRVDFREDSLYYADPCAVLDLAYSYSKRVVLRQDYMPFEFTVFVDLQDDFDKKYTIFPEYLAFIPADEVDPV
jgi:SAM-dependent methyltransferase